MKAQELENKRYSESDHCEMKLEEEIMFEILDSWAKNKKLNKESIEILDIGCGSGLITKKIKDLGYDVKGIDFSEEAVKKALANGIEAKICDLDRGISEKSGQFDVVWAGDILEHVFDPLGLLKEINRVLKNKGIVIMSIPSNVGFATRLRILTGKSYQEETYKIHGVYKHHTFFTLGLITFMLDKNGFLLKEVHKILNINQKRFSFKFLPSFFYNELVIKAEKAENKD